MEHKHRVKTNGRNCGFADKIILKIYQTMERDYIFKEYKTFLGKLASFGTVALKACFWLLLSQATKVTPSAALTTESFIETKTSEQHLSFK